jgi:hypothetical protein
MQSPKLSPKHQAEEQMNRKSVIPCSHLLTSVIVIGMLVSGAPSIAQEKAPSGREIAEKAKSVTLHREPVIHGKKDGKNVKFTKADLGHLKSPQEVESGQVIGVLETEIEGDESGLPPGKYNLYLKKVGGEWKVYAESGGKVVGQAARVEVKTHGKPSGEVIPRFEPEGWCLFNICIVDCWIFCCVEVGIVCF